MSSLPPLTQQPVLSIDGTPDAEYPIRILQAYRENCNCMWADSTEGELPANPLLRLMNEHNVYRAFILDEAIEILRRVKL